MMGEKERLRDFADEIRSAGFTSAVLLGMGGSSLASDVFVSCFGRADGYLDLRVLNTTVPASILDLERSVDLEHTLFIVSSKSGGTIEVLSLYKYFRSRMERLLGTKRAPVSSPLPILGPASESSRRSMASERCFSIRLTSAGDSARSHILDWYPRLS